MDTQRRSHLGPQSQPMCECMRCCKLTSCLGNQYPEDSHRHRADMSVGAGMTLHVHSDSAFLSRRDQSQAHTRLYSRSMCHHSRCSEDSHPRLPDKTTDVGSSARCRFAPQSHTIGAHQPSRTQLCMATTSHRSHDSQGSRPPRAYSTTAVDTLRHGQIALQPPPILARSPAHSCWNTAASCLGSRHSQGTRHLQVDS